MDRLTFRQAADYLNVSLDYFTKLVIEGRIPRYSTGMVLLSDMTAFKHERDIDRREGFKELARMSQEFGGYDDD